MVLFSHSPGLIPAVWPVPQAAAGEPLGLWRIRPAFRRCPGKCAGSDVPRGRHRFLRFSYLPVFNVADIGIVVGVVSFVMV